MATYNFLLNPRAFAAMLRGSKKNEIRVKTEEEPFCYEQLVCGDTLVFTNLESGERLAATLLSATHYKDVETLLANEVISQTLSSTTDPVAGARSVRSFKGYAEGMEKNGCWALHLDGAHLIG